MVRKAPCQNCKYSRRKCERSNDSEFCFRCIRLKKICKPQTTSSSSSSSVEDDEDIASEKYNDLCQQINEMQIEIQELEKSLIKQKSAAVVKQEPVWNLRLENGQIILDSEIKNFQEFQLYARSFIRYLSPFGKTFQTTSLIFKKVNSSILQKAILTFSTLASTKNEYVKDKYVDNCIMQCIQPSMFVDKLIDIYFRCYNNFVPILHESSYRKHIQTIENKLEDPIILAICTAASVYTCPHSIFNSHEKRYFGEYFYARCMEKLVDIFDEPGKELESLIIINILQTFMFITMRFNECKKWASVGACLAATLRNNYPDCKNGRNLLDETTRAMYAIIHRNCIYGFSVLQLINFSMNETYDCFERIQEPLDVLPDEPELAKNIVETINHVMQLERHPLTRATNQKSGLFVRGKAIELTLEDIIQYETIVSEWWHDLPEYLKISKKRFDCTKELIESCSDPRKLLMSIYAHSLIINVQVNFFYPELGSTVHHIVKDKANYLVIHASQMVLAAVKRIQQLNAFCFCKFMLL
ncbi:hypothetical protein G6F38_009478 [Rhizopus arrhizus]|nr:hypothetical protein G6F38_009478 [Rhizopus arrhizus]